MSNKTLCFVDDNPGKLLYNDIKYIVEEILGYNFKFFEGGNTIEDAYSYFIKIHESNYDDFFFLIDMDMPISPKLERGWGIDREINDLNGIYLIKQIVKQHFPIGNLAILTHYTSIKHKLEDYDLSSLENRFFTKYDFSFDPIIKWLTEK